MKTVTLISDMQAVSMQAHRDGRRIGFVPTMGFLHEGHMSLIRQARRLSDVVVVSIFVNPMQFGPHEDLAKYPRDFERDARSCEEEGVEIIFAPTAAYMYAPNHSAYVEDAVLSAGLCGASRPGHFRGVATVVAKLFNIVQPNVAVFGQKDAQQARIIEQMARDLNFPVEIIVLPTVREEGGLAMSSRNKYLSAGEREQARCLYTALCAAEKMCWDGTLDAKRILGEMRSLIERVPCARIEYIEIVDYDNLKPVDRIEGETLIALAVRIGQTRLIDNLLINPVTG